MPTCSWIRERDIEAFYAAVETVPLPGGTLPPVWHCPFCAAYLPEAAGFQVHLEAGHSGRRPFLTIDGVEPKSPEIVRKQIDDTAVNLSTQQKYLSAVINRVF